jgi:hypothetical protein
MKGSEFAATVGKQSLQAWESAAFDLEKSGANIRPIFVPVPLAHKDGRTAVIDVATDYFSVGEEGDFIRLPLLPVTAQKIGNLTGLLMPTPMLVYRIWQAAIKLKRQSIAALGESNKGPNFAQYVKHNAAIQEQISGTPRSTLLSGHKKDIVVSNLMKPGHVVIFGWYKPAPDVFNDGTPWTTPDRQPQQAHSNEHGLLRRLLTRRSLPVTAHDHRGQGCRNGEGLHRQRPFRFRIQRRSGPQAAIPGTLSCGRPRPHRLERSLSTTHHTRLRGRGYRSSHRTEPRVTL